MTYSELKIALDIGDSETVLSSITKLYNDFDSVYFGHYFVVCDDGDVHCFSKDGIEKKIEYIPYYCFAHRLFKKIIPETVTSIGDCAFSYCSELESMKIPNSVTHIS